MPQVPFHSNFRALACLDCRAGVHSIIYNRNPEHITELGSIQVSNHTSFHFAEIGSGLKFPRKYPSHAPSSFPFHFPTTRPSRSPGQGPSGNFQLGTPRHRPAQIQLKNFPGNLHGLSQAYTRLPPRQIYTMCTQPHSWFKLYTITSPYTHPSNHPYQSPTITPSARPTPTPSHIWAIPGRFGRPHGSHCTCIQSWIPILGPVLDEVVYPVICRGSEEIITPPTHISFLLVTAVSLSLVRQATMRSCN